ncbi:molybdate transport system substrate-binding protein [Isoptericola jiangsuensis]|uniref:Molybdate transport system substrate-binding protein n=1 Tax=Isoptericola jiangsuensis TaxID=548579 RepID=A0A2A9ETR5_9MICO|nr:molybdate ABC transporter substrate-binding protein [Isoptericola jiangsuensis]PFG41559.1 molybdate transport system substrate-binding protein [Isoptericola jiangsuensis]
MTVALAGRRARTTSGTRAPRRVAVAVALGVGAAATTAACSSGDAAGDDGAATTTLTVFAAASLTEAFEQVAADFEAAHAGVDVRLSFAGSSDLVAQVQQGAPADVLASADTATMDRLVADDLVDDPRVFATNTLTIAVPAGNPAGVTGLADLADPALTLVLCAPEVPCGAASARVAEAAGLDLAPDSEEQSVTDVLGKVAAGEADAGLVYVTDVARGGDAVEGVAFPEAANAVNTYPVAAVADAAQPVLAAEFVDAVLSPEGRAVLAGVGFAPPSS